MKDINFFSYYQSKNKENKDILKYLYGILIAFAAFVVISLAVNTVRILILNNQINKYSEKLNDSEIQSELKEANKVNSEIDILQKYGKKIGEISDKVSERDNVSYNLLQSINSKVPSDVSFKKMEVKSNQITIQGISKSNDAVADFQHNLKDLSNMSDVFVESMDNSGSVEGEYSFEIKCVLKDAE